MTMIQPPRLVPSSYRREMHHFILKNDLSVALYHRPSSWLALAHTRRIRGVYEFIVRGEGGPSLRALHLAAPPPQRASACYIDIARHTIQPAVRWSWIQQRHSFVSLAACRWVRSAITVSIQQNKNEISKIFESVLFSFVIDLPLVQEL
jgi:hypothetical protein